MASRAAPEILSGSPLRKTAAFGLGSWLLVWQAKREDQRPKTRKQIALNPTAYRYSKEDIQNFSEIVLEATQAVSRQLGTELKLHINIDNRKTISRHFVIPTIDKYDFQKAESKVRFASPLASILSFAARNLELDNENTGTNLAQPNAAAASCTTRCGVWYDSGDKSYHGGYVTNCGGGDIRTDFGQVGYNKKFALLCAN